jgi:hypothetical protein
LRIADNGTEWVAGRRSEVRCGDGILERRPLKEGRSALSPCTSVPDLCPPPVRQVTVPYMSSVPAPTGHVGTRADTKWDTILPGWDTILPRWDTKWDTILPGWDTILSRWDIKWDTILPKWDTKGHQWTPFWCPMSLWSSSRPIEGSLRGFRRRCE